MDGLMIAFMAGQGAMTIFMIGMLFTMNGKLERHLGKYNGD